MPESVGAVGGRSGAAQGRTEAAEEGSKAVLYSAWAADGHMRVWLAGALSFVGEPRAICHSVVPAPAAPGTQ